MNHPAIDWVGTLEGHIILNIDEPYKTPALKALKHLEEKLESYNDLLRRLREWDMLNSYTDGDGEVREPTADAPYWRSEIDRVRAGGRIERS